MPRLHVVYEFSSIQIGYEYNIGETVELFYKNFSIRLMLSTEN